ncbi:serine/threonine protein kinase [Nocardiopsis sp. EMB25]|uniref:serine/threonine-protein kinase n=1 Tax=Nocardiopsis sp. EMB25 TaxID=2835867 RepID=UPI002284C65C|nr:serine/threonine-protein kinase [Nocardiopsis sp. EMB25]MCY9782648.1 serine/threonine protein kinase [Nocardiopsis sp. EMB25]
MPSNGRSRVDRYVIRERLGGGGMGTVWRAHDPDLHRDVAIKELRLPPDIPEDERDEARARMVREARAAAGVRHPCVVTVHDVLRENGDPYIVMELLSGRSLQQRLRESGALPADQAEHLARSMLRALGTAHRMGVIHRDVKPANIMLTEDAGRIVLTDFGIASVLDASTTLTASGARLGTLEYMAPERFGEDGAPAASDMWSLGITLFRAVGGASPFRRESAVATFRAITEDPVPPPPVGGRLGALIGALLDRDPEARPTPDEAFDMLEPDPPPPSSPPAPGPNRRRALLIGAGAGVGLLGAGSAVHLTGRGARTEWATYGGALYTLRYPEEWERRSGTASEQRMGDGAYSERRTFTEPAGDHRIDTLVLSLEGWNGGEYTGWDWLEETDYNIAGGADSDSTDWERIRLERGPDDPRDWRTAYLEGTYRNTNYAEPARHGLWKTVTVDEVGIHIIRFTVPAAEFSDYERVMTEVVDSFEPVVG